MNSGRVYRANTASKAHSTTTQITARSHVGSGAVGLVVWGVGDMPAILSGRGRLALQGGFAHRHVD